MGLWTGTGTLLASVPVVTGTPVGSTSPDGEWRFESISPIVLSPGTYVIGGTYVASDADVARFSTTATTRPEITFVTERECSGGCSGLTFPDTGSPSTNDGVFGPNLRFEPPIPTPTPTATPLTTPTATPMATSNCCTEHAFPGCDDISCETAVCLLDSFCCAAEWDSLCVNQANLSCAVCGAATPTPTPEPGLLVQLVSGLLGFVVLDKRRRRVKGNA